jgi:hypothetical protein
MVPVAPLPSIDCRTDHSLFFRAAVLQGTKQLEKTMSISEQPHPTESGIFTILAGSTGEQF